LRENRVQELPHSNFKPSPNPSDLRLPPWTQSDAGNKPSPNPSDLRLPPMYLELVKSGGILLAEGRRDGILQNSHTTEPEFDSVKFMGRFCF
jgi:hypothetical protein